MYRLGISRPFGFGFKYYDVVGHKTEVMGAGARITLTFPDGKRLAIPGIHKKKLCFYPQYKQTAAAEDYDAIQSE